MCKLFYIFRRIFRIIESMDFERYSFHFFEVYELYMNSDYNRVAESIGKRNSF